MTDSITLWKQQMNTILQELEELTEVTDRHLFVIGCSTSEVIGEKIGTAGSADVAKMIFQQLEDFQKQTGVQLAFQCCEHLNRALVVERTTAEKRGYEEVSVIPVRTAGGAMATYAFEHFQNPVVVEAIQAEMGMDIGDTLIGMHLKSVAVPLRVSLKNIGSAHVTLAKSRPKLIGGVRAVYERSTENFTCK